MPKKKVDELNSLAKKSKHVDEELFSEQRSNILLTAGNHYSKKTSKWYNRLRESSNASVDSKLRLTKNHIHKITKGYQNNILSLAPQVTPTPNNPKELQDQKAASLNKAVWEYACYTENLKSKISRWCQDFIEIGECIARVYWDPNQGELVGYEQKLDDNNEPVFDENGEPESSGQGIFSGKLCFEPIYGFNLLRSVEARTIDESPWLCIERMSYTDDLKAMVQDDPDKVRMIHESRDETYFVFDQMRGKYGESTGQTLVREFYYRPCREYPNGYFYIATKSVIISEGELPFGIFPIVYGGFDEISTAPRHRSIIKQLRPYQIEINRAASKVAEHQISLGDDKIILQNGSKVTNGPQVPGIRTMMVNGMAPTILPGRSGEQYGPYIQSQISEMYNVANFHEDAELTGQGSDALAYLYKSIRNKKKFSIYAEKFERFLVDLCKVYLDLAKNYYDDQMLIPAIGRAEYINIPEFKSTDPLNFSIKVEPLSEDVDTLMGKHLVLNQILQYNGGNLEKDDLGKLIKQLPFMNTDEIASDLTINYDTATNIILQLDRGEMPSLNKYDDTAYIAKRLSSRMKMSDYQLLSDDIKAKYEGLIGACEQIEADKAAAIKAAQDEFIPTGGGRVKIDFYVQDPNNPSRQVRATVPQESVKWLMDRLQQQGSGMQDLLMQDKGVQSEIAELLLNQQQQSQGVPTGEQVTESPQLQMPGGEI